MPWVCGGVYTVTFTAFDQCSNSNVVTSTITVIDTTSPTITGTLPPEFIEGCTATSVTTAATTVAELEALGLTITDACALDADLIVTSSDASAGTCPMVITRTYTVSDICGRSSSVTQVITVDDTTAPSITCPGPYYQNANPGTCDYTAFSIGTATVTDSCGGTVSVTNNAPAQFPVGVTTVTWTATDECGNQSTCEQYVTIYDIQPPVINCIPTVYTATVGAGNCDVSVGMVTPTYTENCGAPITVSVTRSDGLLITDNFPVGTTTVVWSVTDASNNSTTCTQTVIVTDNINPSIVCPVDQFAIATAPLCQVPALSIPNPTLGDNCSTASLTLSWTKTGSTTDTGTGTVSGTTFNVGVTTVTYTVTDAYGNSASCSFTVTVNDQVPPTVTTCPPDVTVNAAAGICEASVTVPAPVVSDPCGEIVSVSHNSPYSTNSSTTDASGTYPVGTTVVVWSFTDRSGNISTCTQTVIVNDNQPATLVCPPSFSIPADLNQLYATDVALTDPTHGDNCGTYTLTWTMGGATTDTSTNTSGISTVPSSYPLLNIGTNTITYTLTDAGGNVLTCSYAVTVTSKPEIECRPDIVHDADAGTCSHTVDPGVPTLREGAQPITWTYTITGPGNIVEQTGTFTTTTANPALIPIGPYPFKTGTTSITWTASNVSGSDACTQIVTVIDTEPPTYNPPPEPVEFCVISLITATYSSVTNDLDKTPDPDYYLFKNGDTDLDLDLANVTDNCCASTANMLIRWEIHLSNGDVISGLNQPSTHTSDIPLWGDGVTYQDVTHEIWYWITDCNGNEMVDPIVRIITIMPRPELTKMN